MAIRWRRSFRTFISLVALTLWPPVLQGQETVEGYIGMAIAGNLDGPTRALPELKSKYPNSGDVLYLEALLTADGDAAVAIYRQVVRRDPNGAYADDAILKIGEYLYARGLYIQAAQQLKQIPIRYPRSDLIYPSIRMFLNSLLVVGDRDTARFYAQVFAKKYPSITFDLQQGRATSLPDPPVGSPASIRPGQPGDAGAVAAPPVPKEKARLQVGAFGSIANAEQLKRQLEALNYRVKIVNRISSGRNIHVVQIVGFTSRADATAAGKLLQDNYGIDYLVLTVE